MCGRLLFQRAKGQNMLRYLKKYRIYAFLAALFMIGEVAVDMIQPQLMARIVDDGILGLRNGGVPDIPLIASTGTAMILVVLLGGIFGVLCGACANICGQRYGNELRKAAFDRIMHFSFEQTDAFTTGSLITRVTNDITQVQHLVTASVRGFIRSFTFLVSGTVILFSMDVHFLAVAACAFPLVLLDILFVLIRTNPMFAALQERLDGLNTVIHENVSGFRVVKAFVQEDWETERFNRSNEDLVETQLRVLLLISMLRPVMNIVLNIAVVALIWTGAAGVRAGNLEVGRIMAAVTYITQILNGMMMLAMLFQTLSRGIASGRRVKEVLDTRPVIQDGGRLPAGEAAGRNQKEDAMFGWKKKKKDAEKAADPAPEVTFTSLPDDSGEPPAYTLIKTEPDREEDPENVPYYNPMLGIGAPQDTPYVPGGSVSFRGVSFTYPGSSSPVLSDISLEIRPGETFAIIGATGCGKTTLANLIPRFYDAAEGTVLVDGIDVRDYRLDALRERISFVTQKNELFGTTIRDNISVGKPDASDEEIQAAAQAAQAEEFILSQKDGYETEVAEGGMSLSGGQKQRVAIARALLKGAEILILDDSTSALDLLTESKLYEALKERFGGVTKIIIAQRIASVKDADRIAVMEAGRIVGCGSHAELLETCPVYRDICESQLKNDGGEAEAEEPSDFEVLDYMDPDKKETDG